MLWCFLVCFQDTNFYTILITNMCIFQKQHIVPKNIPKKQRLMNIFQRSILMCNSALNYEYLFVLLLQYFIPRVQHGLCPGLRRWPNICGKDPDISFNTGLQDLKVWFFALSTDACVFIVRNSMMALSIIERVIPKGWSCGGQFC